MGAHGYLQTLKGLWVLKDTGGTHECSWPSPVLEGSMGVGEHWGHPWVGEGTHGCSWPSLDLEGSMGAGDHQGHPWVLGDPETPYVTYSTHGCSWPSLDLEGSMSAGEHQGDPWVGEGIHGCWRAQRPHMCPTAPMGDHGHL